MLLDELQRGKIWLRNFHWSHRLLGSSRHSLSFEFSLGHSWQQADWSIHRSISNNLRAKECEGQRRRDVERVERIRFETAWGTWDRWWGEVREGGLDSSEVYQWTWCQHAINTPKKLHQCCTITPRASVLGLPGCVLQSRAETQVAPEAIRTLD
jgi:hypothetical protein